MAKRNIKIQRRVTRNGKVIIQRSKKEKVKIYDVIGFIIVAVVAAVFIITYLIHIISDMIGK